MPGTTNYGLPYPAQLTAGPGPDAPADMKALADAIDVKLTPLTVGTAVQRQAIPAGVVGRRFYESDTGNEYLDIGTAWVQRAAQGPQGIPGRGVPPAGAAGNVLTKASDGDYDTTWAAAGGGGGGGGSDTGIAPIWTLDTSVALTPADWDGDVAHYAVSGGLLRPDTINTDFQMARKGFQINSRTIQTKTIYGSSTAAGTSFGIVLTWVGVNDFYLVQYEGNARNLTAYRRTGGTFVNLFANTGIEATPAAGSARWLRASIIGGTLFAAVYTTDPLTDQGAGLLSYNSVGLSAGSSTERRQQVFNPNYGPGVRCNFPNLTDWSITELKMWRG